MRTSLPFTIVTRFTVERFPRVVTACAVTWITPVATPTFTVGVAVMPGFNPGTVPSSEKVALYEVTPLDVVGSRSIPITLPVAVTFGRASKANDAV